MRNLNILVPALATTFMLASCGAQSPADAFVRCDQNGQCLQEFAKRAPISPGLHPRGWTPPITKWVSIRYNENSPIRQQQIRQVFLSAGWVSARNLHHPTRMRLLCVVDFNTSWTYALTCRSTLVSTISGTSVSDGPQLITRINAIERLHDMLAEDEEISEKEP